MSEKPESFPAQPWQYSVQSEHHLRKYIHKITNLVHSSECLLIFQFPFTEEQTKDVGPKQNFSKRSIRISVINFNKPAAFLTTTCWIYWLFWEKFFWNDRYTVQKFSNWSEKIPEFCLKTIGWFVQRQFYVSRETFSFKVVSWLNFRSSENSLRLLQKTPDFSSSRFKMHSTSR